jgi:hypothetical protein
MATAAATALAQGIRAKITALKAACAGVDEAKASRAPAGRWSPKEILSHLLGPEQGGLIPLLQTFLDSEVPLIELVPEQTHFTGARRDKTFAQLLDEVERKYEGLASYAEGLTDAQLARTAHVPLFKDSPLTDHPTLGAFMGGLGQYHVQMHTDHLREVLA